MDRWMNFLGVRRVFPSSSRSRTAIFEGCAFCTNASMPFSLAFCRKVSCTIRFLGQGSFRLDEHDNLWSCSEVNRFARYFSREMECSIIFSPLLLSISERIAPRVFSSAFLARNVIVCRFVGWLSVQGLWHLESVKCCVIFLTNLKRKKKKTCRIIT